MQSILWIWLKTIFLDIRDLSDKKINKASLALRYKNS